MVRVAHPGGRASTPTSTSRSRSWPTDYANGTLRVTTRQGFQFHGVLKGDLKATIAGVNQRAAHHASPPAATCSATSWAAPRPLDDADHASGARRSREALAARAAARLAGVPRDLARRREAGLHRGGGAVLRRPLPPAEVQDRASASRTDNCVDIWSQDVGLLAIVRTADDHRLQPAGGRRARHDPQQGRHHRPAGAAARLRADGARRRGGAHRRRDLPRPRQPRATAGTPGSSTCSPNGAWSASGPSSQRRAAFPLAPAVRAPAAPLPRPSRPPPPARRPLVLRRLHPERPHHRHRRPAAQDGAARDRHPAPAGRPAHGPAEPAAHRSRRARRRGGGGHPAGARGHAAAPELSAARRFSMACPALPTCGLAVAESERAIPAILDRFEAELERARPSRRAAHHPDDRAAPTAAPGPTPPTSRSSGARSACTTCTSAAGSAGDRLVDLYRADVPARRAARRRAAAAGALGRGARRGEGLGDFYQRLMGRTERRTLRRHRPRAADVELVPLAVARERRALVLAAHGSRRDPAANALVRRLAAGGARAAGCSTRSRSPSTRASPGSTPCSTSWRPTRSRWCR